MQGKRWLAALSAALMLSGASALAFAQQPPAKPAPEMQGMPMDQGMMGGGTMGGGTMGGGMMGGGMMGGGMMGGGMMGGGMMGMMSMMHSMPQMPPGNEKLQFQMHAEMMQKLGEIAAKYAERIK